MEHRTLARWLHPQTRPRLAKAGPARRRMPPFLFPASRILAATLFVATLAGCAERAEQTTPTSERSYSVRGILAAEPGTSARALLIKHEEIPGFMPAMTMLLDVHDQSELAHLRTGDRLTFVLKVTEKDSWIEQVQRTGSGPPLATVSPQPAAAVGPRLKEGQTMPDFSLVDQEGRAVRRDSFGDRALILTFIFTRCPLPNYCPLMTQQFRTLQTAVAARPRLAGKVTFLSISFDEEDTPDKLKSYGRRATDDLESWRFLTGDPQEITRLTRAFAVLVEKDGATLNHGLATAFVDSHGIIRRIWRGNGWKPDEILAALEGDERAPDATP